MELSLRRVEERPLNLRRESGFFSDFDRRMDRIFDEVFGSSLVSYVTPETRGIFSPRMDIRESSNDIKITAEMPGIDREDIDVSVHNGILTISGEKKVEKDEKGTDYHHVERSYGCFSRNISVPETVETDKVEAMYKNGVLTVTLPKAGKAIEQSKKITVEPA
jgi:HSP20 family protein